MEYSWVSLLGVSFAALVALGVTIEYPILVNLRRNSGAKMFFTLLLTIDALIGLVVARAFLGDYALRIPLLTFGFYVFGAALLCIGVSIYRNQVGGARAAHIRRRDRGSRR